MAKAAVYIAENKKDPNIIQRLEQLHKIAKIVTKTLDDEDYYAKILREGVTGLGHIIDNWYKIGMVQNKLRLVSRMGTHNSGSPFGIKYRMAIEVNDKSDAYKLEGEVHRVLSKRGFRQGASSEWFNGSLIDIRQIVVHTANQLNIPYRIISKREIGNLRKKGKEYAKRRPKKKNSGTDSSAVKKANQ